MSKAVGKKEFIVPPIGGIISHFRRKPVLQTSPKRRVFLTPHCLSGHIQQTRYIMAILFERFDPAFQTLQARGRDPIRFFRRPGLRNIPCGGDQAVAFHDFKDSVDARQIGPFSRKAGQVADALRKPVAMQRALCQHRQNGRLNEPIQGRAAAGAFFRIYRRTFSSDRHSFLILQVHFDCAKTPCQ